MTTYATITISDRSGYARSQEPVVMSIPLAESAALTGFGSLGMRESGSLIDAQFAVLSRWGDVANSANPIRVLQAIFRASVGANSSSSLYTLEDGGSGTASGGISVNTSNANYIEITTGTTAGSGRFRIRTVAGGGHNVLELGEVHTGAAFKTVLATGNASALYLHGVTTAGDHSFVTGSVDSPTYASCPGTTLIFSLNGGANTIVTFAAGEDTLAEVLQAVINRSTVIYGSGQGVYARRKNQGTYTGIELYATGPVSDSFVVRSTGTANSLLGFSTGSDTASAKRANNQNADYLSSAYTAAAYTVSVESSGPERVVILVTGKLGATPFQGMNDEINASEHSWSRVVGNGDLTYEARYLFYRNSAYVGLDWLIKAPGSLSSIMRDCAIDHGGIQVAPNFSGSGTDVFVSAHDNAGSQQGEELNWTTGVARLFQVVSPSGAGYTFSLNKNLFTLTGSTQLREALMVVQDSTADRHVILMHQYAKEQAPHGFWYNGTIGCLSLWPTEVGEVSANYTARGYHLLGGANYYRWRGGLMLGNGGYTSSAVRSAWSRWCRAPIIAHAGAAYHRSRALGPIPPSSLTRVGAPDWNEAFTRRMDRALARVEPTSSTDGRSAQVLYDDRNNGQYSLYDWNTFGAWPSITFCASNRYDATLRFINNWMITGDPRLWEWGERLADHMAFLCTEHGEYSEMGGADQPWTQYSEGGLQEGNPHILVKNLGVASEINSNMYKAVMYQLTGYLPFKDAALKLITERRGRLYENIPLTNNSATSYLYASRVYTFGIEDFLSVFWMQGDPTSLQYLRNLAINIMVYGDRRASGLEEAPNPVTTISTQGGLGHLPNRGYDNLPRMTEATYAAYGADAMWMAHDVGVWSRAHGYTAFSVQDVDRLATFCRQAAKMFLVGTDALTRNLANTPASRASSAPPVIRGHNKGAGQNTLMMSQYLWQWADTDAGGPNTRCADDGASIWYQGTATVSGTSVTNLSPTPGTQIGLMDTYLYVVADGPSAAVRVTAHTLGGTSATLATSYPGTTGAGLSIICGGVSGGGTTGSVATVTDLWVQVINICAYAAKLYKDASDLPRHDYLLSVVRDFFENMYLFNSHGTVSNWDTPFAQTFRGQIRLGTEFGADERWDGWHMRVGSQWYLDYEAQLQAAEALGPISVATFVVF